MSERTWSLHGFETRQRRGRQLVLLAVVGLHGMALTGLLWARAEGVPQTSLRETVQISFIAAPPQPVQQKPPPPPPPVKKQRLQPQVIATAAPTQAAMTVEAPPPEPPTPAPPAPPAEPAAQPAVIPPHAAAYLDNPKPIYPTTSRLRRETGQVMLRVLVSAEGRADKVEVKTSSGYFRLDDAAVEAVSRWKFLPARRGDTPVADWVLVPIVFERRG